MYKEVSALDNQLSLISHKTQRNQIIYMCMYKEDLEI